MFKYLSKYEFWTEQMEKDIKEIINTKKGNINYDFWRKIIMETKEIIRETVDCQDKEVEKNVIRGWICHFYPGLKKNLERNSYDLLDEVLKVPVHIKQIGNNEETKEALIYTGIRDLKQDPNSFIVEPIVNYCFSLENDHHILPIEF